MNINIDEIKKGKNYCGNGVYYYDSSKNKLDGFYKYNSCINKDEIPRIRLKKNQYLIQIVNNQINILKKSSDDILTWK